MTATATLSPLNSSFAPSSFASGVANENTPGVTSTAYGALFASFRLMELISITSSTSIVTLSNCRIWIICSSSKETLAFDVVMVSIVRCIMPYKLINLLYTCKKHMSLFNLGEYKNQATGSKAPKLVGCQTNEKARKYMLNDMPWI